jgi:3-deoxy-7-phosphoheptulonate synthase
MAFKYIQQIPSPEIIKAEISLTQEWVAKKAVLDDDIKAVFENKSSKKILVIGPCSADNEDAVMEYVYRLSRVQEQVKDQLILIPRIYTNKPRTNGVGYKGMLHQPDPNEKPDMHKGIYSIRKLHIRVLTEAGLTTADEMLYPENYSYLEDLIGYIAVGARSVENQMHRLTASGIEKPVGMKNPTSGDLKVMLNSIKAAQMPHEFIYRGIEVETEGNPLSHAILRGAVNQYGRNIPNYHYEDLLFLSRKYKESKLDNASVIVDCNHANSMKLWQEQSRIAMEVMSHARHNSDIKDLVKGLMIESYLVGGTQPVNGTTFGQSITDGCLSWEASEKLIYQIAEWI